jgi:non-ribosomal peptide synthase protein (TIGR01720 family)
MFDVVLSSIALTLSRWSGMSTLPFEVFGHGRESLFPGVNVWRTVGWFATVFPVRFELGRSPSEEDALRAVHAQMRAVPKGGVGFGILRYLGRDVAEIQAMSTPPPEIGFNYRGHFARLQVPDTPRMLEPAHQPIGESQDPNSLRRYVFYIESGLVSRALEVRWMYGPALHRAETVAALAAGCMSALRALIHNDGRHIV